nr:unnamed protein product [Callosobruchus chinensis]
MSRSILRSALGKNRYLAILWNRTQQSNLHISAVNMAKEYNKDDLRKRLTPLQYQVTQEKGTERPFSGCYNKTYDTGTYVCIVCEQPLFSSETKYDSGCGWPAFNDVLDQGRIKLSPDTSGGIFLRHETFF